MQTVVRLTASRSTELWSFLQSPPPMSYDKYLEHIDTTMGADTPIAFGLHPNAEIDFRTQQSDTMFKVRNKQAVCMSHFLSRYFCNARYGHTATTSLLAWCL